MVTAHALLVLVLGVLRLADAQECESPEYLTTCLQTARKKDLNLRCQEACEYVSFSTHVQTVGTQPHVPTSPPSPHARHLTAHAPDVLRCSLRLLTSFLAPSPPSPPSSSSYTADHFSNVLHRFIFHSIMQCLDVCYKEPFITSFYKQELAAKKALDLVRYMRRTHTKQADSASVLHLP